MTPPHPGEFLRVGAIEVRGLTVGKAGEILGVPERQPSKLLNGGAEFTPVVAHPLERAFSVGENMLLRMQKWDNASQRRERSGEVRSRVEFHERQRFSATLTGS